MLVNDEMLVYAVVASVEGEKRCDETTNMWRYHDVGDHSCRHGRAHQCRAPTGTPFSFYRSAERGLYNTFTPHAGHK